MIIQYLSKVEHEEGKKEIVEEGKKEIVETVRDNVTDVDEFEDRVEITFSRPNGEFSRVTFGKPHSQITNMWLLNDNFKTLKRLI